MIEEVMVCWLQVHYAEVMYAQAIEAKASRAISAEKAIQQETASQRFTASLKQLVELRTLLPGNGDVWHRAATAATHSAADEWHHDRRGR